MSPKLLIMIAGLATLALLAGAPQAPSWAQTAQPGSPATPTARRVTPRIKVSPRPLLYRRCIDWYELQYRPSGTVLYPQMRCWWVRG